MRIVIMYDGADLFVQGEWASMYSPSHSKRLTEDMPLPVQEAALQVIEWANAEEINLRTAIEKRETAANLRREINLLEAKERAVLGG